MKIPIRNLYFLLAYAWDRLEEADSLKISPNDFDDAANLLARLLISGVQKIIKTGLERCYVEHEAEYRGIKGKLLLTETVKKQLHRKGRTVCAFDEYTKNSVNNRILKSTLIAIKRAPSINKKQRQEASDCLDHFLETEAGLLSSQIFQRARIGRSNVHYKLPLKVSEMIYQHSFVDEKSGDTVFRDFLREEKAMARLYEDFLFNFYKREQRRFSVKRENIEWHTVEESADRHLLPIMRTDISLQSEDIKLVIDAKYYQKTLTELFQLLGQR